MRRIAEEFRCSVGYVNAEELVCPGSHVDVIRLALRPLLIHESINGIIHGGTLDKASFQPV